MNEFEVTDTHVRGLRRNETKWDPFRRLPDAAAWLRGVTTTSYCRLRNHDLRSVHLSEAEIIDIYPPPKQPASGAGSRTPPGLGSRLARLKPVILILIVVLGCATVGGILIAEPVRVVQPSMEATLLPDQYVLVDRLIPSLTGYQRRDVIMLTLPGESPGDTAFVSRVVGLPGDTVDLRNGHVLIDDREITEPYVYEGQPTESVPGGQASWVVPSGTLFVLSDRRSNAVDSRTFGPVPLANVIGRAWFRCWPLGSLSLLSPP